ncbi:unnamed protein product [Adineta steineri]|uniref:ADP-ribosylation factor-like protein 6 n=1 Tax=Adineta steineri TaxID=433720 RepID=A0A815BJJ6_9BILA|nr:unnamed protein product [Adineta steineri]CAF1272485.1 unnamed protein product [Adineta steineri]CAF1470712.1 unnamed protein product [Adineta steineri]CAF3989742.1 unnamed protein product [Adineta steineri]CAF4080244.1 unnamed protein product [Adineta steineri]
MNSSTKSVVNKPASVLITGSSGSGKRTIVHMIKHGKIPDGFPTIGVDFEKLTINETPLMVWSIGGRSGYRPLLTQYYRRMLGFIFVVDSNDHAGVDEARKKLHEIIDNDSFEEKPILIFANKQDLPNAMNNDQLRNKLHLDKLNKNIKWYLQTTSAIENQGLDEGFEWLMNFIQDKNDKINPIVETYNDTITMKNHFISFFNIIEFTTFIRKITSSSFNFLENIIKY